MGWVRLFTRFGRVGLAVLGFLLTAVGAALTWLFAAEAQRAAALKAIRQFGLTYRTPLAVGLVAAACVCFGVFVGAQSVLRRQRSRESARPIVIAATQAVSSAQVLLTGQESPADPKKTEELSRAVEDVTLLRASLVELHGSGRAGRWAVKAGEDLAEQLEAALDAYAQPTHALETRVSNARAILLGTAQQAARRMGVSLRDKA